MPDPELQVVTTVTGWPPEKVERLMAAIRFIEADTVVESNDELEVSGWTKALVERALERLAGSRASVQIKAIKAAIENGGVVHREEVYQLGAYGQARSLKGFTRPINRATSFLRDSDDLPEDADELLEPIYDPAIRGYQRAKGFRVPADIVKLYTT